MLNPNNRTHRTKFKEKIDAYLKDTKLSKKVALLRTNQATIHEINTIDKEIPYILNAARKYVERPKSNICFQHKKKIKYQKYCILRHI